MKRMQAEVINANKEERKIVTENLYSSRTDEVNTVGSLVNDGACGGRSEDATCGF